MKIRKKILIILIIICTFISTLIYINPVQAANTATNGSTNQKSSVPAPNFTISAKGAILMDASSGSVLYGKAQNEKLYPASTTKILTAILAIEKCTLSEKITASYDAVMSLPSGYSNAAIQPGETLTCQELLEMFLLHSANEIGTIFAEHISGSVEKFATLMNKKAAEIGCKNTHFTNPSGIHDEDHYSTVYDMALIGRYCMQNETFRKIVSKVSCTIEPTDKYEKRYFRNTNDLIDPASDFYTDYVIGTKTGYTSQAKHCLVSTSLKNNLELISVVLGAPSSKERYQDTINLLEYGNSNYKIQKIATKNSIVKEINVENATKTTSNVSLLVKNDITGIVPANLNSTDYDYSIKLNDLVSAPIQEGAVLGKITYTIGNFEYSTELIANHNVEEFAPITIFYQIALALFVLFILSKLLLPKKKSKKKKYKKNKSGKRKKSIYN